MPETSLHGAHVYRSEIDERIVRGWCEDRITEFPDLVSLPELTTSLGPTRAFRLPGGSGSPVVVLSGTNFNSALSASPASDMTGDREVILVDVPGQPGLSCGVRPRRHGAAAYGAWFDEVLPKLVDRPAIVLAHSRGAAVALAARPCPLIKGLVLLSPAGLAAPAMSAELMRATLPWMLGATDDRSTRLLNFLSGPDGQRPDHPFAPWMTLVGRHCRTSLAPGPLPVESLLPWRDQNVTVATGSHDVFFAPSRVWAPARKILGTRTHELPGIGHLALYECSERVRELVDEVDDRPRDAGTSD